jgi:hypothetical protein
MGLRIPQNVLYLSLTFSRFSYTFAQHCFPCLSDLSRMCYSRRCILNFLTGKLPFSGGPRLTSLLRALGVITFILSVASPYDDGIQQEASRPKSPHVVFRRLPPASHGIQKTRVEIRIVTAVSKSLMPKLFDSVTPVTAALSLIPLYSALVPRSPPCADTTSI